jgi:hypothetical protein
MTAQEVLLDALRYYEIAVSSKNDNIIKVIKNYSIEVEQNGVYKLYDDDNVIAPFDDIDELCRFILL